LKTLPLKLRTRKEGVRFVKGDNLGDIDFMTLRVITFVPIFVRGITDEDTFDGQKI